MLLSAFRMLPALMALCTLPAFAQHATTRFSLSAGVDYIARQDQIFSPFVHGGVSAANAALSWERSKQLDHLFELRFGSLSADRWASYQYSWNPEPEQYATHPHQFTMVDLNYGVAMSRSLGNARFQLGGIWENNVQALSYNTGPFSFFGYFAAFGLGPWAGISSPVGEKSTLDIGLRAPLVAWTARSPYLVNDDPFIENTSSHSGLKTFLSFVEDGVLHLPDKLQKLTFSARYLRHSGKRMDIGIAYRLQFIRHTVPLSLISYQHSLGVQIGLKPGRS